MSPGFTRLKTPRADGRSALARQCAAPKADIYLGILYKGQRQHDHPKLPRQCRFCTPVPTASGLPYTHTRHGGECIGGQPISHGRVAAVPTGPPASDMRFLHSDDIRPPRHDSGLGGRSDAP
jgi:hypothetical protein